MMEIWLFTVSGLFKVRMIATTCLDAQKKLTFYLDQLPVLDGEFNVAMMERIEP